MRKDVEITTDGSAFFTSDRLAVRAIMRLAFAFPHGAATQKIRLATT